MMETKFLKLQGTAGKTEYLYNLELDVPSKQQLLTLIEGPPHCILSKNDITFSSGILAQVSHSLKLRISRDYQEPFVGIHVKLTPNPEDLVDILDIKGSFIIATPNPSTTSTSNENPNGNNAPLTSTTSQNVNPLQNSNNINNPSPTIFNNCAAFGNINERERGVVQNPFAPFAPRFGGMDPLLQILNRNQLRDLSSRQFVNPISSPTDQNQAQFNFQRTSKKYPEMDTDYDYYESHCHYWPQTETKLRVTLRVTETNYSEIVNADDVNSQSFQSPSSLFNAEPFFMSENCSDVKIKVGNTVIPAHKIILSARSEYFARMFASPMRESFERIVEIGDVEENLLKKLLSFIYLGKVDDLDEYANDLFLLADKYDIPGLSSYCEKHLLSKLDKDNAMEMYDISHTVGYRGILSKKSKEMFMWNKEKCSPDLDTLKAFFNKYPDLILELMKV